jgi:hypothetical protein
LNFATNSKILEKMSLWLTCSTRLVPPLGSEEFEEWSKYMEKLNQVWVFINKENEPAQWPMVSLTFTIFHSVCDCQLDNGKAQADRAHVKG